MPGFDRSGPMGGGPMTGGARGYCLPGNSGYERPLGYGRGLRKGFSCGRGFRRGNGPGFFQYPPLPVAQTADELQALKQQAGIIEKSLAAIHQKIADLEKPK